jgi:DNA topoisomerase I
VAVGEVVQVSLGGARIDRGPGFHRIDGQSSWVDDSGAPVVDEVAVAHLRRLAIPPAWVQVWATSDPMHRVQATGVDARGRTQYRYAAAATAFAADQKFDHMLAFADALPALRSRVAADLHRRRDPTTNPPANYLPANLVIAGIVRLLERGLFRVGNERYARDNHTYGLTTIHRENLTVKGSATTFDFVGKEHLRRRVTVVDRDAARVVAALLDQPGAPDAELFVAGGPGAAHSIHSTEVNAYLHNHTGAPATAKVFRTWGATAAAAAVVGGAQTHTGAGRSIEATAIRAAADLLGNTPTVARSSYVHPAAFDAGRSATVAAAIDGAATRLRSLDVRVLFVDPNVQSAVLEALRATESDT